jgi:GIY-YIG catalytic domain
VLCLDIAERMKRNRLAHVAPLAQETEYPFLSVSPLTHKKIVVDRFLIPRREEMYGACLSRGGVRYCCESREQCKKYNASFGRLRKIGKNKHGVYMLCAGSYENVMYIGQSNNLYGRLSTHGSTDNLLDRIRKHTGKDIFCEVHVMEDIWEKFYWEQRWIAEHEPKFNLFKN